MVTASVQEKLIDLNRSPVVVYLSTFCGENSYHKFAGHLRTYKTGISLVPGENGAPVSNPHPWEKVKDHDILTFSEVNPSDVKAGDVVRLTLPDVDKEEGKAYPDFRVVGFVRGISQNALFLAPGINGFPTGYSRGDITKYEKAQRIR